jgi:predicted ribosome quality control (RQC) complex YloA/Tae2 family protein
MDGLTLTKISNILKRNIINLKINRCLVDDDVIQFTFSNYNKILNFSLKTNNTFIYYSGDLLPTKKRLQYLDNSTVEDIYNVSFERVIFLKLSKYRGSGKKVSYTCIFELFSKYPNFYVLDEDDKIVFRLKEHCLDASRGNLLGDVYVMVRKNKEASIDKSDEVHFEDMQGFYNVTAHYANILTSELGFEKTRKLILDSLSDDKFYIDDKDRIIPFPLKSYKSLLNFDELSGYVNVTSKSREVNEKKNKILNYLYKIKNENEKALVKINNELKEARDYKNVLENAELLKNNLHLINNKTGLVYLNKYTEGGIEKIEYNLTNSRDAKSYVEKLFARGKKLKRALNYLEDRVKKIDKQIAEIDKQINEIEKIEDLEAIQMYENYYLDHQKNIVRDVSLPFFRVNKGDVLYIVGKNKKSNNLIISRLSRKDDMWFHVREAPSAHVIARKNGVLNEEEIVFGAKLAATFSKLKNDQKVAVDYTLRKYVTKPKGSPEGFVHYTNFKTILVEPFENIEELQVS